jgi:hypothetical protein
MAQESSAVMDVELKNNYINELHLKLSTIIYNLCYFAFPTKSFSHLHGIESSSWIGSSGLYCLGFRAMVSQLGVDARRGVATFRYDVPSIGGRVGSSRSSSKPLSWPSSSTNVNVVVGGGIFVYQMKQMVNTFILKNKRV